METEQTLEDIKEDNAIIELDIIKFPNNRLKDVSISINPTEFGQYTKMISCLFYTMKVNGAIAISAPTCGIPIRLIVLNVDKPLVMFNPHIVQYSKEVTSMDEGNLSIPGYFYKTDRANNIDVVYEDIDGNNIHLTVDGLQAFAIQHEIDSLNGISFLTKLSTLRQMILTRKIKKHIKATK